MLKKYVWSLSYLFVICSQSVVKKQNSQAAKEEQIRIESVSGQDQTRYLEIVLDPRVSEHHAGAYKKSDEQRKHSISYWNNKQRTGEKCYQMYKITYHGIVVGFIELYGDKTDQDVAYIAYSIDPQYWKKGIGTMAVKQIIQRFRPDLKGINVKYIRATVRINNPGSIKVLKKNGFQVIEEKLFSDCPVQVLELIL